MQVANTLADRGVRVIVAGLDQDYVGRPFEPMPQLLAVAEYVDKTLAICMQCGAPANRTQRLVAATDRVVVGGGRTSTRRAAGAASSRAPRVPKGNGEARLLAWLGDSARGDIPLCTERLEPRAGRPRHECCSSA